MFDFLKHRPSAEAKSELATYQSIRNASKTWFPKVMDHPIMHAFELIKAAKQVGLPVRDGGVVFEDAELEGAMLMDFFLFDYRPKRMSPAESCIFDDGELKPLEAEFHRAAIAGHLSLFEVVGLHEHLPRIRLQDLLHRDRADLWLTDINLSASFHRLGPALIFTRVVTLRELNLTGGFSFVFDIRHKAPLIDGYQRAMWSVPRAKQGERRTPHFYAQHLLHGTPQTFGDIG